MSPRIRQSPFGHRLVPTHIGFSIEPSRIDPEIAGALTVRRIDADDLDRAVPGTGSAKGDSSHPKELHRHLTDGIGPGYLVCGRDGVPVVACLRIAGGLKTRATIQQRIGGFVPRIGEREHLLASVWIAPSSSPTDLAQAFAALVRVDLPGHLSRTVVFMPLPVRTQTLSALAALGARRYIYCLRRRCVPFLWRTRHDWIGPGQPSAFAVSGRSEHHQSTSQSTLQHQETVND